MKKTIVTLISAIMVIAMVFALAGCNSSDDKTAETKATTATQAQTEKTTDAPTQAQTEEETQAPTEAPTEAENSIVLPDVTGTWKHENYPQGCSIDVTAQDGNTLSFTIYAIRGNGAQIASCDKTVTLDVEMDGSFVRGSAHFDYTDSFLNEGTCTLSVTENVITLVVNQEVDGGAGWSMAHATGDYIFAG